MPHSETKNATDRQTDKVTTVHLINTFCKGIIKLKNFQLTTRSLSRADTEMMVSLMTRLLKMDARYGVFRKNGIWFTTCVMSIRTVANALLNLLTALTVI